MCSPTLVDFLNENFLFWGAAVNKQEGFKVSNLLSASTFPFLAVLCTINLNGSSTTMLDRIEGVTSVEDFLSRLAVVLENYGPVLINAKLDAYVIYFIFIFYFLFFLVIFYFYYFIIYCFIIEFEKKELLMIYLILFYYYI